MCNCRAKTMNPKVNQVNGRPTKADFLWSSAFCVACYNYQNHCTVVYNDLAKHKMMDACVYRRLCWNGYYSSIFVFWSMFTLYLTYTQPLAVFEVWNADTVKPPAICCSKSPSCSTCNSYASMRTLIWFIVNTFVTSWTVHLHHYTSFPSPPISLLLLFTLPCHFLWCHNFLLLSAGKRLVRERYWSHVASPLIAGIPFGVSSTAWTAQWRSFHSVSIIALQIVCRLVNLLAVWFCHVYMCMCYQLSYF